MPTRRQQRVSEQIHREISSLLMFESRDPRLAPITITDVEITQDLMLARIYFTTLGTQEDQQAALAGLKQAAGFLRTQLAGRMKLRFVPELVFLVDDSAAYGRRIDEILNRLAGAGAQSAQPGKPADDGS